MHRITLDAEASQVFAELAYRGFGWLADEPDLYTNAGVVQPRAA